LESKTIAPILPRILRESISKLDGTLNSLKSTPGEFGSRLQQQINLVYAKNPDLHIDLLTPKRNRLTEENLEKLLIINANKSILCNNLIILKDISLVLKNLKILHLNNK
jgi:hypothetical protein